MDKIKLKSFRGFLGLELFKGLDSPINDPGHLEIDNIESWKIWLNSNTKSPFSEKVIMSCNKKEFIKNLILKNAYGLENIRFILKDKELSLFNLYNINRSINEIKQNFGFNLFKNWHNSFPIDRINTGVSALQVDEPRIKAFLNRISINGFRVLDIGCLEGLHSMLLEANGANEIIGVEGRAENFLRCLVIKNLFDLDKCTFLHGDISDILPIFSKPFDLVVALGILYHLENPVKIIFRSGQLASRILGWTHYATETCPKKGNFDTITYCGKTYKGKYTIEHVMNRLSGLSNKVFWLSEDDLLKAVEDAGFKKITVINKEKHAHGPAITFLGEK